MILTFLAAKSNWHRRNTSTRGYERYRRAVASGKSTKDYSAYRDNKSFLVEVSNDPFSPQEIYQD